MFVFNNDYCFAANKPIVLDYDKINIETAFLIPKIEIQKDSTNIHNNYTKDKGYYVNKYIITNKDYDSIDLTLKEFSDLSSHTKNMKQYKKERMKDRFPLIIARPLKVTLETAAIIPVVIVCPIIIGFMEDSAPMRDLPDGIAHNYLDPMLKTVAFPYYIFKDIIDDKNTVNQMKKYSISSNVHVASGEQIELFLLTRGKKGLTDFLIKKENYTNQ